ncbi:MAG TPA: hypothetical protein VFS42_09680 [Burkholderiaceae bacterium]|nr:hypothetical protein [Burkholderiaceae bacterium]
MAPPISDAQSLPVELEISPASIVLTLPPRTRGGFSRITLTQEAYIHLEEAGHLKRKYDDKSFFIVRVDQSFVDHVVAHARPLTGVQSGRQVLRAKMPQEIGFERTQDGVKTTKFVTLVVQQGSAAPIGQDRVHNEIITMHPGR